MLEVVRHDPHWYKCERSRWTLALLLSVCSWLELSSVSGLSRLLRRLGIVYKQGRSYVHSPDLHYVQKWSAILTTLRSVRADSAHKVLLFLDEVTINRQPLPAPDYEAQGHAQPLARRSHSADTKMRILGALNPLTGAVVVRRAKATNVACFKQFWQQLVEAYPDKEIFVVVDNWPMHFHPDVLASLAPQTRSADFRCSSSWQALLAERAKQPHTGTLPIQLLPLPTFASWLNPIEKLWRKLKQEVVLQHRMADNWPALQNAIDTFLAQYATPSPALLRYVGLQNLDRFTNCQHIL